MGGICPLYFDGATCYFEELPKPNDVEGINKIYRQLNQINSTNTKTPVFFSKIFKNFKNLINTK
jgi:hypothetical protein